MIKRFLPLGLACFGLTLSGCLKDCQPEDIDFAPSYPLSMEKDLSNATSIYGNRFSLNLYGNNRHYAVGDIVLVSVNEATSLSTSASNSYARTFNTQAQGPKLFGFSLPSFKERGATTRTTIDNDVTNSNATNGKFSQTHNQTISFLVGATVAAILPNGNLIIRGEKEFFANDSSEILRVRGIARLQDIDSNNTIAAERLGDLKFQFDHTGRLSEGAKPGWFSGYWSKAWPF